MFDQEEYYDSVMASEAEVYTCTNSNSSQSLRNKKCKINARRFSDEQIQSLESIFETESRLEPRKKLQLARELGLQPRQVAIWFQNKRARWKSKKMERDYNTLLANYNSLAARYEALKKEKQAWVIKLHKLNELMQKPQEDSQSCEQIKAANSMDSHESYNGDTMKCEVEEAKPSLSEQGQLLLPSGCNSSIKTEYFALEDESDLLNWMEPAEGSRTSQEDRDKFDQSNGLLNESAGVCPWWDFWS